MTARRRLADRRLAETFELEVSGQRYTCTVGRFTDNSIGELFLNSSKSNSTADTNARDSAIVFSFAVQHGADPERYAVPCLATARAAQPVRSPPRSTSSRSAPHDRAR
jgi:hypothetical protein